MSKRLYLSWLFSFFAICPFNLAQADSAPIGYVDGVVGGRLRGWAFDPAFSGDSIWVHVYADGPAGTGWMVGAVQANQTRTDVNTAYGIAGAHGFSFDLPHDLTINVRNIWVYGIASDWRESALMSRSPSTTFGTSINVATTPVAQTYDGWAARYQQNVERVAYCKNVPPDVLFIGDSITQLWSEESYGLAAWNRYFRPLNALNVGVGGDVTEGMLYEQMNGTFPDGWKTKLNVVLMGTNNLYYSDWPVWIAEGIWNEMNLIYNRANGTKILILSLLPRGEYNGVNYDQEVAEVNAFLSTFADNVHVFYLDVGKYFKNADGTQDTSLFEADLLHPNKKGYDKLGKVLYPKVRSLLGLKGNRRIPRRCVRTLETVGRYHY